MLPEHNVTPRNLLSILPSLYLKTYPLYLRQIEKSCVPSLTAYFLDQTIKQTTLYGTYVCNSLLIYINERDKTLMDIYQMTICSPLADILKQQRGIQYGFGDDVNCDEYIY